MVTREESEISEQPAVTSKSSALDEAVAGLIKIVIGFTVWCFIMKILYPDLDIRRHLLWIESPTKHTIKSLPFYQALRVVRKHNWHLVETQPIQKQLTRWEAFKYLIWGNRKGV